MSIQTNAEDIYHAGIWKIWPFNIVARHLWAMENTQELLENRFLSFHQEQKTAEGNLSAVLLALKKVEVAARQHEQNSLIQVDRLDQDIVHIVDKKIASIEAKVKTLQQQTAAILAEIESSVARIVGVTGSHQYPHQIEPGQIKIQDDNFVGRDNPSVFRAPLNEIEKTIAALQVQVRAQSLRLKMLAASGSHLSWPDTPVSHFGHHSAGEFNRLSMREKNIALQLKLLADAEHQSASYELNLQGAGAE